MSAADDTRTQRPMERSQPGLPAGGPGGEGNAPHPGGWSETTSRPARPVSSAHPASLWLTPRSTPSKIAQNQRVEAGATEVAFQTTPRQSR